MPHPVGTGDDVKYVLRWYGYTISEDFVELPADIPEHFITHYGLEIPKEDARGQGQRKVNRS